MKSRVFWIIQHLKGFAQDLRFTAKCWWLSQHVDFLEWRWRVDGLLPSSRPAMVPIQRSGLRVVRSRAAYTARHCSIEKLRRKVSKSACH